MNEYSHVLKKNFIQKNWWWLDLAPKLKRTNPWPSSFHQFICEETEAWINQWLAQLTQLGKMAGSLILGPESRQGL